MILSVKTVNDVKRFFTQIIGEGTNIHPDDDFRNIVSVQTGEQTYTSEEAALRNKLMKKSFEICENSAIDIYNLGLTIHLKKTQLDKYIPLPN